MKRTFAAMTISALLFAGLVSISSSPTDIGPMTTWDDIALYRYDANRTGVAPFVGNIDNPSVRWVFNTSADIITPPLIADVNADGRYEVTVAADNGGIYVIDENGAFLTSAYLAPEYPMMPAAADIDGDGLPEIIVGQGTHDVLGGSLEIHALNGEDLSTLWSYTSTSTSERGFFASPMFHDCNGDGILDVLLGSMDDHFYALNGPDGTSIWKSPKGLHYIRATSAMDDIDNDGEQEIVGLDNAAQMRLYDADTGAIEWETKLGYGVGSSPLIADLDGDGYGEIASFMVVTGGIQVLNHDGSVLWNDTSRSDFYSSPTIAQIDGDGLPDLIVGDFNNHTILAYRGTDGTPLWQTVLPDNVRAQSSLVTADVDGDGEIEVLALGKDRNLFSIDAQTGAIEWTFGVERPFGQPTIWDLDQDGIAEIVLSAAGGLVYVIEQAAQPVSTPRTIGYWKHQCEVTDPTAEHPGIAEEYVQAIADSSLVFDGVQSAEDLCDVLMSSPRSDMTGKALKQLMALWLNVVSGYVDTSAEIDLAGLTDADTVGDAISDIEDILLHSTDKAELERGKNIADALNNGMNG
jgi:outer membrane protein assembly factor BamB